MALKRVEDLTPEEVKERVSLYQRPCYYETQNTQENIEGRRESKRNYCQKKKAAKEERKKMEDEANGGNSEERSKGNNTILQRKKWRSEGRSPYCLGRFCQVIRVNWQRFFGWATLRNCAFSWCLATAANKKLQFSGHKHFSCDEVRKRCPKNWRELTLYTPCRTTAQNAHSQILHLPKNIATRFFNF